MNVCNPIVVIMTNYDLSIVIIVLNSRYKFLGSKKKYVKNREVNENKKLKRPNF